MILAGGTGGHIFPGLAVAKVAACAWRAPVTWLGADGAMETRLVPQHDIAIDTLAISGLRGKGKLALLGAPVRVLRAIRAAGFVLRERTAARGGELRWLCRRARRTGGAADAVAAAGARTESCAGHDHTRCFRVSRGAC